MHDDFLFIIAEIAAAFAGFAGLVVVISRREDQSPEQALLVLGNLQNVLTLRLPGRWSADSLDVSGQRGRLPRGHCRNRAVCDWNSPAFVLPRRPIGTSVPRRFCIPSRLHFNRRGSSATWLVDRDGRRMRFLIPA